MFDLQALAFAADITRVFALKMSRDVSNRVFSEAGATTGFHIASHHNEREDRITDFAKINRYHVGLIPYFLEKLKQIPDGNGTVLDNALIVYGSPMGNPNVHNHKRCPLFLAGHAGGRIKGNMHIQAPDGTPMANAMLAGAAQSRARHRHLRRQHGAARSQRGGDHETEGSSGLSRVLGVSRRFSGVLGVLAPLALSAAPWRQRADRRRRRCAKDAAAVLSADQGRQGDVNAPAGRRHDGTALGGECKGDADLTAHAALRRRQRARDDAARGVYGAAPRGAGRPGAGAWRG